VQGRGWSRGVFGGDASTEETPVSRFERGRGCVVGGDASIEKISPPPRVLSKGGGLSLVVMRQ